MANSQRTKLGEITKGKTWQKSQKTLMMIRVAVGCGLRFGDSCIVFLFVQSAETPKGQSLENAQLAKLEQITKKP